MAQPTTRMTLNISHYLHKHLKYQAGEVTYLKVLRAGCLLVIEMSRGGLCPIAWCESHR